MPPEADVQLRQKVLQQAELLAQQKAAQAIRNRAAIEAGWQLKCSFMARFYTTHREYDDIVDG